MAPVSLILLSLIVELCISHESVGNCGEVDFHFQHSSKISKRSPLLNSLLTGLGSSISASTAGGKKPSSNVKINNLPKQSAVTVSPESLKVVPVFALSLTKQLSTEVNQSANPVSPEDIVMHANAPYNFIVYRVLDWTKKEKA